jgi:NAD(P)-dependent dehydrogenase (short-subunit alcohol dehydrogenase family)
MPALEHIRQLLLINNAGVVSPIASAGFYPTAEVSRALAINLTAPILLTDALLRLMTRWIANCALPAFPRAPPSRPIRAGAFMAAARPGWITSADMSPEQQAGNVRIAAIYPGVIDTDMQASIRSSDPQQFPTGTL